LRAAARVTTREWVFPQRDDFVIVVESVPALIPIDLSSVVVASSIAPMPRDAAGSPDLSLSSRSMDQSLLSCFH